MEIGIQILCLSNQLNWTIVRKCIDILFNKKYNKNVLIVKQKVGVIDDCEDGKTVIR